MQTRAPDQHALNIAHAIQQAAAPDIVVMFGSRATGKYREDSDLDILIIREDEGKDNAAGPAAAARIYMDENPPRLEVNVVTMTLSNFQHCRRAKQHLAGQADQYGVFMSGERLNYTAGYEDDYDEHWPATRQRLENTAEWSKEFNDMVEGNHWNQKTLRFAAKQTVENVLQGLLSAHNDPEMFRHNLNRIWNHYVDHHHDPSDPDTVQLHESVTELLDHTTYENPSSSTGYSNWLSDYASEYRYNKTPRAMNQDEKITLQELINNAVGQLTDRIHSLSETSEDDLFPNGKPWE